MILKIRVKYPNRIMETFIITRRPRCPTRWGIFTTLSWFPSARRERQRVQMVGQRSYVRHSLLHSEVYDSSMRRFEPSRIRFQNMPSESGPSALAPKGPGSAMELALPLLRRHPLIPNQTINLRRDGGAGRTALTFRRDPRRVQKKLVSLPIGWWCAWVNIPTRDSWEHVGAPEGALRGGSCYPRIPGRHRF